MCGLAGFLLNRASVLPEREMLARAQRMIRRLRHRGPDGQGVWSEGEIALAHARLAIIDTSAGAKQPMQDSQGLVQVVYNGEIYNFRSLRRELEAAGHTFRTASDTEVLIHGYKQWELALFPRLAGMFAVALWDARRRRLVLTRDRLGEKPLVYARRPEGFLFASEIKALLTWPGCRRVADQDRLHDYLTFGFITGPGTAYQGIERLPPGHVMVVENGEAVSLERYWQLPSIDEQSPRVPQLLKRELVDRLTAIVEDTLIADVPLGAFLSGGVDSSAVVATMVARCGRTNVETFSSGFGRGEYDETEFAAMIAERYGTRHRAFRFGAELLAETGKLAWYYDEPFSDSSALVAYALARETRKSVTVALTGDGADEIFLGYSRYFKFGEMMRARPRRGGRRLGELYRARISGAEARLAATDAYGYLMERFREGHKLRAYGLDMLPWLRNCSYERLLPFFVETETPEEMAARFDIGIYLPDDLLVKIDIAAMANGLETRAPFLNHELVEFAARIPAHQRAWNREGKALLKSAMEPYLPRECLYRTKMGFRVPVAHFMREEARDETSAILLSERFLDRGIVRAEFVRKIIEDHTAGVEEHGTRLWALLMLELWFRTWIDADMDRPVSDSDDPFAKFGAAQTEHALAAAA